jgi:hypothetical protein
MTPNQLQFRAALVAAYARLFAESAEYAYSASKTTPEALADRMLAATLVGTANTTGPGFRMACKACGVPHTGKAIDAFMGIAAPAKTPKVPRKDSGAYMLAASGIESIMSGAVAAFASGDSVTLKYSDGSSERADCPEQAALIRNYAKGNGDAPNFFAIVSAVQSKRAPALA